jgi:hypothetical protein
MSSIADRGIVSGRLPESQGSVGENENRSEPNPAILTDDGVGHRGENRANEPNPSPFGAEIARTNPTQAPSAPKSRERTQLPRAGREKRMQSTDFGLCRVFRAG